MNRISIPSRNFLYAVEALAENRRRYEKVAGVSVHIGSQTTDVSSFADALEPVADLVRALRTQGHDIRHVDAGAVAWGFPMKAPRKISPSGSPPTLALCSSPCAD